VDLLAGDPEAAALDLEAANITKAQDAYRADPALAADLEQTGWFAERMTAAREGRAISSEGRRQADPVLRLPTQPGQVQLRPSAWAGFTNLLAEVSQRRMELLERRRPQILAKIAQQEIQLRERILDTRVRDLAPLIAEADELLRLAVQARGPIPRTIRTTSGLAPVRYRERTDELELVDAATGGWSLLDPLPHDEPTSLATATYGVQRDDRPSVAEGRDRSVHYGTHRSAG
jgi:hypothetical protein